MVLIPKEKDATDISQFQPISLLNVEGKIFFSIIAQRLSTYLERNKYIDISVQKAGIMAGCTISPLAFTVAMEVIIRASRWVVDGEKTKDRAPSPTYQSRHG